VEKLLKEIRVGNAKLLLGGSIVTEDNRGRRTPQSCGLFWNPWECGDKTVEALNSVVLENDPGSSISIEVFEVSLRDRKIVQKLPPTFSRINSTEKVWVWEYEIPIAVFISGEGASENWAVSHWRMLSGRVVFDAAKNKFRLEEGANRISDGGNGHGGKPEIAQSDPDPRVIEAIVAAQCDNGTAKRNGR